jgi:hypothetical protein
VTIVEHVLSLFGCRHPLRSVPFTDPILGTYVCCLECGRKLKYREPELIKDHPYLREVVHAR